MLVGTLRLLSHKAEDGDYTSAEHSDDHRILDECLTALIAAG